MTNQSGTNEQEKYTRAWAAMLINIWEEKMLLMNLQNADTNSLFNSLQYHITSSGMGREVISHFFNYYGIYVDRGTGKEIWIGNPGDVEFTPNREAKPWFGQKFYYYTHRLAEKLAEINLQNASSIITNVIEGK